MSGGGSARWGQGARPGRGARIVGVDVATQPKSVGVALCTLEGRVVRVDEVCAEKTWDDIDRRIGTWLAEPALLAVDAPLGWPLRLADALHGHRAGASIPGASNALFRRTTDDVVAAALGKRPLDVGADRIARTAHAALALLERLRKAHGMEIPLAWTPGRVCETSAIEVYPAGTLASRGLVSSGYKGSGEAAVGVRRRILEGLMGARGVGRGADADGRGPGLRAEGDAVAAMTSSDHLLDAVLCGLAGADFIEQRVIMPDDLERAQREGWIWVSSRSDG